MDFQFKEFSFLLKIEYIYYFFIYKKMLIYQYLLVFDAQGFLGSFDDENQSLLHNAVEFNQYEIIKYLIEYDNELLKNNKHILISAIMKNDLEIVKYLIKKGASASQWYLTWSCQYSSINIIKLLIEEYKLDIHFEDDEAYRMANDYDRKDVMKFLNNIQ